MLSFSYLAIKQPFWNTIPIWNSFYSRIEPSARDMDIFPIKVGPFERTTLYRTTDGLGFIYRYFILASIAMPFLVSRGNIVNVITF
jgi:hypothetical protein